MSSLSNRPLSLCTCVIIKDAVTKHYRRFGIEGREMRVKIQPPPFDANVYEWLESIMQELYRRLCATATPEDFIGVTLSSERFVHGPAWISFRRVTDVSAYDLWDKLASVDNTFFKLTIHF